MVTRSSFKRCPKCQQLLAIYDVETGMYTFGKNRACPDGLATYCKECRAKLKRQKRVVPELLMAVASEYPSRVSLPEYMRRQADEYMKCGMKCEVVTPSGRRLKWEEME